MYHRVGHRPVRALVDSPESVTSAQNDRVGIGYHDRAHEAVFERLVNGQALAPWPTLLDLGNDYVVNTLLPPILDVLKRPLSVQASRLERDDDTGVKAHSGASSSSTMDEST